MADLIERSELRKDFCNMCEAMQPEMVDCNKKGCMSMQIIDEQPTIEAEPVRHGVWECGGFCSVCGLDNEERKTDYCPNCGARMDLRTPTEVALDIADSVMMGGAENE